MLKKLLLYLSIVLPNTILANNVIKSNVIILPLDFEQNLPTTNIKIQNKNIKVLVDTGANNTTVALSNEVSKNLRNLTHEGKDISFYNACGEKSTYKAIRIPELHLDTSTIHNVSAYVYPVVMGCGTNASQFPDNIKGIIGINLMKEYKVIFDYSTHKIVFFKENMPQDYSKLKWFWFTFMTSQNGNIIISAVINNKKVNLMLDTGASNSILDPDLNIKGTYSACPQNEAECRLLIVKNLLLNSIDIGEMEFLIFASIKIHSIDSLYDGILGSDLLKKHKILIDFKHQKLAIENT